MQGKTNEQIYTKIPVNKIEPKTDRCEYNLDQIEIKVIVMDTWSPNANDVMLTRLIDDDNEQESNSTKNDASAVSEWFANYRVFQLIVKKHNKWEEWVVCLYVLVPFQTLKNLHFIRFSSPDRPKSITFPRTSPTKNTILLQA